MRGGESNRAVAPPPRSEPGGPRRGLHMGTDAGRLWIVVGRWSVLITPRHVVVGLMLLALSLAVAVAALRLGKFPVSTPEVIDALQGQGRRIVQVVVVDPHQEPAVDRDEHRADGDPHQDEAQPGESAT